MTFKRAGTCIVDGCANSADAANEKLCAVHATRPLFSSEGAPEVERKAPPSPVAALAAINRGKGSQKEPYPLGATQDPTRRFERERQEVLSIAKQYGEVWVDTSRDGSSAIINGLFGEGLVNPISRVARQHRFSTRYRLTPKGKAVAK